MYLAVLVNGPFKGTQRNSSKGYNITDKKQHPSNKTSLHPSHCRDFPWANWIWGKKIYHYNGFILLLSLRHPCLLSCMSLLKICQVFGWQTAVWELLLSVSMCVCVCVCSDPRGQVSVEVPATSGLLPRSKWGKGPLALLRQWEGLKHTEEGTRWQWGLQHQKKK